MRSAAEVGSSEQREEAKNPMASSGDLLEAGKGRVSKNDAHLRGFATEEGKVPLCTERVEQKDCDY